MPDRVKTLVAVMIVLSLPFLLILIIGLVLSGKSVVSPIPEENPIQIIILTPVPSPTGQAVRGTDSL